MYTWIIDIETTNPPDKIHLVGLLNTETNETRLCHTPAELKSTIKSSDRFIGHNLIAFDIPILNKLWKTSIQTKSCTDTLVLSRLYNPSLENGHSLEEWGKRLGVTKEGVTGIDFNNPDMELLRKRNLSDLKITALLYQKLTNDLEADGFSGESQRNEHMVQHIIAQQEAQGVLLNAPYTMTLLSNLQHRFVAVRDELVSSFEPTVVVMKTKTKLIPFNPGSRKQVYERLTAMGWQPELWTDPGNPKKRLSTEEKKDDSQPVIDDDILASLALKFPKAKGLAEYYMLQKRIAQVNSWLDATDDNWRIHGKVFTIGAITNRMTHSDPNLAQVPKAHKRVPYGVECRSCFIPSPGKVFVGIDASGLELRMLAHYMNDPDYTREVVEGDVHTRNMQAAGLPDREIAKVFIYAFLYGAGEAKIGSIIGGSKRHGRALIEKFLIGVPSLAKLKDKVAKIAKTGSLPGIDGRRVRVRHAHAALNTLLQSAGAIIMKHALVLFYEKLQELKLDAKFVLNVHDEWQLECDAKIADQVGKLGVEAIRDAGIILMCRCPLTGEYKVGRNWAETH